MTYSTNPQRDKEYRAIESLAERLYRGELGDEEKGVKIIKGIAHTLKMNEKIVTAIIAAVKDNLKGLDI